MYPELMVIPMREELVRAGIEETRSAEEGRRFVRLDDRAFSRRRLDHVREALDLAPRAQLETASCRHAQEVN